MSDGAFYTAEPTGVKFHASSAKVRCIRGPIGSGKTVMSWMEIIRKTAEAMPPMPDGVVRAKWVVMRNTYDELKSTTVPTAMDWFSKIHVMDMHWSPPLEGVIRMPTPKGDPMEITLLFRAMDTPGAINHLLGLEISGIYANEGCQIPFRAIEAAMSRLGRYPKMDGDKRYPSLGVIMDTNPLDTGNWWYRKEMERPDGWEFFIQPPALLRVVNPETGAITYENNVGQDPMIPAAENVSHQNLGFQYWRNQLGSSQEIIDRFVLNKWVTRRAGKPVYPEWNQDIHTAKTPIEFSHGLPIIIGQDFGRTPCAVICQLGLDGQLRVLEEVISDNMGISQFVKERLRPLLINKYGFYEVRTMCFADPAGADPANQVDDATCIATMNNLGIQTIASPVTPFGQRGYHNSSVTRINNVSELLNQRIGSAPALIVNPCCKVLIGGFNGDYHYRKMRTGDFDDDSPQYSDEPEKPHPVSDVHDALQYVVCGVKNSGMDFSNPYLINDDLSDYSAAISSVSSGMAVF